MMQGEVKKMAKMSNCSSSEDMMSNCSSSEAMMSYESTSIKKKFPKYTRIKEIETDVPIDFQSGIHHCQEVPQGVPF